MYKPLSGLLENSSSRIKASLSFVEHPENLSGCSVTGDSDRSTVGRIASIRLSLICTKEMDFAFSFGSMVFTST